MCLFPEEGPNGKDSLYTPWYESREWEGSSLTLGIGIITYNRLPILQRCVANIARHTRLPYTLMIADDGSEDDTVPWARGQDISVVTGPRRGVAWNKNRALYYLQMYTECDPILLFEDDTWPLTEGWETVWIAAARRWQHVNYGYAFNPQVVPGSGTAEDPYQLPAFGGHCTITTRRALEEVGFLDSRFLGYGWEHVEWTHRFRIRYEAEWDLAEMLLPCLNHGVHQTWPKSFFDQKDLDHNAQVYAAIRANPAEVMNYRLPWRNEAERLRLQDEVLQGWKESMLTRYGSLITPTI